jgi:predicted RND superfamily exporter protein
VRRVEGIPVLYRDRFGGEDAEALVEDMLSSPFYKHFLINENATVAGLLVEAAPPATAEGRRDMVAAIRAAAAPLRDFGYEVHLAGPPLLNAVIDTASQREVQRTFPPAIAISLLVMLLLLRSWRATLVAALCAGLSVSATMGLMGLLHRPLTMVSSVLPSLLWVLALAACVHVLRQYQVLRAEGLAPSAATAQAAAEMRRPCLIAGITTAAGFLSLLTAGMPPVQELGFFAALGMCIILGMSLLVCPLLAVLLGVGGVKARDREARWPIRTAAFARRNRLTVIAGAAAFSLSCIALLPWLHVESDPLSFLPKDSETVQDYRFVGQHLTGFYSLEAVIELGAPWSDPEQWPALEQIQAEALALPGVVRVLSPLDVLKKLQHFQAHFDPAAYRLPADEAEARDLLASLDDEGQAMLKHFVAASGTQVRMSVLINEMNSLAFTRIVNGVEDAMGATRDADDAWCTGIVLQLVHSQLALVRTQVQSFALALVVIFLCMAVGLRSLRLAILSMAPNVLPILATLALMALLGVPLNAATVMVASVALGIAVDDTAHVLAGFQGGLSRGDTPANAMTHALSTSGPAMVTTTLTTCAGFAALLFSQFVPLVWFGGFACVALFIALAADLLLTPAVCSRAET